MSWLLFGLVPVYLLTLDKKLWMLLQQPQIRLLLGGAGACLLLFWQVKAQLPDGPALHFIGITCTTLLLGLRLSLCLIPLILLTTTLATLLVAPAQLSSTEQLFWDWWVLVVLALQSYLQLWWVNRQFGQHLFIYIFVATFAGSALCAVTFVVLQSLLFTMSATQPIDLSDYFALAPLLALPEAILNGMAMTLLLVYKPEWVATYQPAP